MNTDSIWSRAAQKIDKDYDANTMGLAATNPAKQFQAISKVMILGLGDVYNKLIGPQKLKKIFKSQLVTFLNQKQTSLQIYSTDIKKGQ